PAAAGVGASPLSQSAVSPAEQAAQSLASALGLVGKGRSSSAQASAPASIAETALSTSTAVPGASVTLTYTIQTDQSPLQVRLIAAMRGPDGVWLFNSSDPSVWLASNLNTTTSDLAVPFTAGLGVYDVGLAILSADETTIYS